ncbi:ECF transporter S component [Bacillus xiapuensis]|uniref:ECF transporter S component n=1 Tax=Bacillus xiapuensis TaxID=2014075 RepID=A0ABU6NAC2_9BACI|nr:ECF transporter S component [Bacillus xiapuensis]
MKNKFDGKKLSWLALFTALSVVGASIKIPAFVDSVALDVFPALMAAALLGGRFGAIAAAFGHLLSAMLGGFPLGPMHILIAGEMAVLVWLFGALYINKRILASIVFVLGNTFAAPLPFIFLMSMGFYVAIVPSLLVGSIINVLIGFLLIPRISGLFKITHQKEELKQ